MTRIRHTRKTAAFLSAMALLLTLWGGAAHAALRSGGAVTCGGGTLVQTRAHASGDTHFRHHQNSAYRGDTFDLGGGAYRTYTSGYTQIYNSAIPTRAWIVWNEDLNFIGEARSFCSPPP